MRRPIESFDLFIQGTTPKKSVLESEESGVLVPSHEELRELPWYVWLSALVHSIGRDAKWVTGSRAYANHTRNLAVDRNLYGIYPTHGFVYRNSHSMLKRAFSSLEDWNETLFDIYGRELADLLKVSTKTIKKIYRERDAETVSRLWSAKMLPDSVLSAMLLPISSPEEAENYLYLAKMGLL